MKFEIMCIDSNGSVVSKTIEQLLYAFLSNGELFESWTKNEKSLISKDGALTVSIQKYPSIDSNLHKKGYQQSYTITLESNEENVFDEFRIKLISYIKRNIGFAVIRILRDELSKKYASSVYPVLYELENNVRTFITNFFLKNLGIDWINVVLDKNSRDKIKNRADNEEIFVKSKLVDADVLLLDFDELGSILFGNKSIFYKAKSTDDILKKIESSSNLEELKKDVLSGSFSKYFKDCFEQQSFESKWRRLYMLRNKIAHNSYFTISEVDEIKRLCAELSEIIENAYDLLDTFKLSQEDMEFVKNFSIEKNAEVNNDEVRCIDAVNNKNEFPGAYDYKGITETKVKKEFEILSSKRDFVGLQFFVRTYLVEKGYNYEDVLSVVSKLIDDGYFIKKTKANPYGFNDTAIIEKQ